MRTRLKSFLLIAFLGISALSYSQTATWTKNFANEGEIRSETDNEIVVTLTGAETFSTTIATDDGEASTFVDGMTGHSSEWGVILSGITAANISLSGSDKIATISIPQSEDYFITADDVIGFTIPIVSHSGASTIPCSSDLTITNLETTVAFGGDLTSSAEETDIRGGSNTLDLTLTNNKWVPGIATTTERLDTIKGMFSGASEFGAMVTALTTGDISVNGDSTILTITFPAKSDYYLTADENIDVEARQRLLQFSEPYTDSTHSFTVSNVAPTVEYGGNLFTGITESILRSGGQTYSLTLTDNLWKTEIETETAERDLIRGMFSNSTKFAPLASALDFGNLDVSPDFKTLTITFPEKTDYFIASSDVVTVTPHQDLLVYPEAYSSTSTTFTISNEDPIIFIVSKSLSEQDVRDGNSFQIKLRGDIWVKPTSALSADFKDRVSAGGSSEWNSSIQSHLVIARAND